MALTNIEIAQLKELLEKTTLEDYAVMDGVKSFANQTLRQWNNQMKTDLRVGEAVEVEGHGTGTIVSHRRTRVEVELDGANGRQVFSVPLIRCKPIRNNRVNASPELEGAIAKIWGNKI